MRRRPEKQREQAKGPGACVLVTRLPCGAAVCGWLARLIVSPRTLLPCERWCWRWAGRVPSSDPKARRKRTARQRMLYLRFVYRVALFQDLNLG
jgi:hypothetical protein